MNFATGLYCIKLQNSLFCLFFADVNQMDRMRRKKEQIMYVCLLLASLWVLVLTNVPHHHHLDGSLCVAWCESFPAGAHAHAHGCDTKTGNHPQMIVNERNEEWKIKADISDDDRPGGTSVDCVLSFPLSEYAFIHLSSLSRISLFIVNTSFHSIWITNAIGLRAPPFSF